MCSGNSAQLTHVSQPYHRSFFAYACNFSFFFFDRCGNALLFFYFRKFWTRFRESLYVSAIFSRKERVGNYTYQITFARASTLIASSCSFRKLILLSKKKCWANCIGSTCTYTQNAKKKCREKKKNQNLNDSRWKYAYVRKWGEPTLETDAENQTQSALSNYQLNRTHYCYCNILFWVDWLTELPKNKSAARLYRSAVRAEFFRFSYIFFCYFRFLVYTSVYDYFFSGRSWSETDDCFICARRESMSSMFSSSSLYSMDDDVAVVDDWKCVRNSFALFPSTMTLCLYCERKKCILSFGWRKRRGGKIHSDFYDIVWCLMQHAIYVFLCAFMAMPLMTRI